MGRDVTMGLLVLATALLVGACSGTAADAALRSGAAPGARGIAPCPFQHAQEAGYQYLEGATRALRDRRETIRRAEEQVPHDFVIRIRSVFPDLPNYPDHRIVQALGSKFEVVDRCDDGETDEVRVLARVQRDDWEGQLARVEVDGRIAESVGKLPAWVPVRSRLVVGLFRRRGDETTLDGFGTHVRERYEAWIRNLLSQSIEMLSTDEATLCAGDDAEEGTFRVRGSYYQDAELWKLSVRVEQRSGVAWKLIQTDELELHGRKLFDDWMAKVRECGGEGARLRLDLKQRRYVAGDPLDLEIEVSSPAFVSLLQEFEWEGRRVVAALLPPSCSDHDGALALEGGRRYRVRDLVRPSCRLGLGLADGVATSEEKLHVVASKGRLDPLAGCVEEVGAAVPGEPPQRLASPDCLRRAISAQREQIVAVAEVAYEVRASR